MDDRSIQIERETPEGPGLCMLLICLASIAAVLTGYFLKSM